jgi:lipopolysaccharide transport system ATP-binding protein
MADIAIKVESLSKLYQIGTSRSGSLRESLADKWNILTGKKSEATQDFWALRDLSFEIRQGEAVGIIGKNGAGKSTLLKILSRITEPSKGRIEIDGRVASLLEVGTGFHPELSGRENVFLNGTILGMTRREIKARFDEIVDFSGVEKFIDTPVKYYSSGMYVRLAFAVAAHLEPEILIIDEVLAVGDAEFQKKCLTKMEDVTRNHGRTILYVSHNLWTVKHLCSHGLVLNKGQLKYAGNATAASEYYMNHFAKPVEDNQSVGGVFTLGKADKKGMKQVRLYCDDQLTDVIYTGGKFRFEIDFQDEHRIREVVLGFVIKNSFGKEVMGINNRHCGNVLFSEPVSQGTITTEFDYLPLYGDGRYTVDLYFGDSEVNYDVVEDAFSFILKPCDAYGSGRELDKSLNEVFFKEINMYGSTVFA